MKAIFALGAVLAAPLAMGQIQSLDQTAKGGGSLDVSGRGKANVTEVRVIARRDGDFEIRVLTTRWWVGRGTWDDNRGRISFRLYTWDGYQADGSGSVDLTNRDRVEEASFDVRSDGRSVKLRFEQGDYYSGNPYGFSIKKTEDGSGNWSGTDVSRDRMRKARVDLRKEGDGWVSFTGDRTHEFRVRWSGQGDQLKLEVFEGPDKRRWSGSGFVRLSRDRKSFTEVTISARSESTRERDQFQASFRTGLRPSDAPWGPGNQVPGAGGNLPSFFEMNESKKGSGDWSWFGREPVRATTVSVKLDRGGRAEIRIFAGRDGARFTGTWRVDRGYRVRLDVTDCEGQGRCSGTGWVDIASTRRDFDRIVLEGFVGNGRFKLDFKTN